MAKRWYRFDQVTAKQQQDGEQPLLRSPAPLWYWKLFRQWQKSRDQYGNLRTVRTPTSSDIKISSAIGVIYGRLRVWTLTTIRHWRNVLIAYLGIASIYIRPRICCFFFNRNRTYSSCCNGRLADQIRSVAPSGPQQKFLSLITIVKQR